MAINDIDLIKYNEAKSSRSLDLFTHMNHLGVELFNSACIAEACVLPVWLALVTFWGHSFKPHWQ